MKLGLLTLLVSLSAAVSLHSESTVMGHNLTLQEANEAINQFDKKQRGKLSWTDFKNMVRHKNGRTGISRGQWRFIHQNFLKYAGSDHAINA